ncbi:hypothetical protein BJX63DRAFT_421631 [Aspergillus granulosus]|uniref:Xylanolytic transcriptional activator regulatory domain-containing protein n=1 Tax=Aspergillus granulosus TaxID=176169 RepID=A0ABR4HBC5_9EURO
MYHTPKRVRTTESGACSYYVKRKKRCYIGVKGIPCTTCHRLKLPCDGSVKAQKKSRSNPGVSATAPPDNYHAIIHQLLGPRGEVEPHKVQIPDYITSLPDRLDAADLQYLEAKGALCVPVLDLDPFLRAISENNGSNTISLLLFHAVMFAGAAFVDSSYINPEGYTSPAAARAILFQQTKVLLELHCEDDRLATVQALLLLVHWHDIQNIEKDASHWIGICLSLAISIGLHRNLVTMMTIGGEHHASEAPEVGVIKLNNFHFEVISADVCAMVDNCAVLSSLEHQTTHATFVKKTKLCRLSQFSEFATSELQFWERHLPPAAQHNFPVYLDPTAWEKSIHLHRTWLRLLYLGTSYAAVMEEMREVGDPVLLPFSLGLSEFLPGPAVALLVLAFTYQRRVLARQTSGTPKSALKLHQCWNIMSRLQDTSMLAKRMQASLANTAISDQWERLSLGLSIL